MSRLDRPVSAWWLAAILAATVLVIALMVMARFL